MRRSFAQDFTGLWAHARIPDDIEQLAKELHAKDGWPDGWVAVRRTIRFERDRMPSDLLQRLRDLEAVLRPQDLTQKIEVYVLSRSHHMVDLAEIEDDEDSSSGHVESWEKVGEFVVDLGRQVANKPEILGPLLPDLLCNGTGQFSQFGRGIAMGAPDLQKFWNQCRTTLSGIPESDRNVALLCGVIEAAKGRSPDVVNHFLDEAVTDPILGPFFPHLQSSDQIDESSVERILKALTTGLSKAAVFQYLGYGRVLDKISSADFRRIALGVAELPDGLNAAVDLLGMRLYSMGSDKIEVDHDVLALGRELLILVDFQSRNDSFDHHLNNIAKICLQDEAARDAAIKVCRNLANALSDYRSGASHFGALAATLFELHPLVALDIFLGETGGSMSLSSRFYLDRENPVNNVPPDILLAWADHGPSDRYPKLAEEIRLLEPSEDKEILRLSPLALQLIERAPDRSAILEILGARFRPSSWSGSLADALARYLAPLHQLLDHTDHDIAEWAQRMITSLTKQIEDERQQDRQVDESFE